MSETGFLRKKAILVTLADENYLDQAKQVFSSAYFQAGWSGDFMLLAHEVEESKLEWFRKKGILVRPCKKLSEISVGRYPPAVFSKLYLFTEDFKAWDHVVYLDADIIIRDSLNSLLAIDGFAAVAEFYPLKGQFSGLDQENKPILEELTSRFDLNKPSFNVGLLSFPTRLITPDTFSEALDLLNCYGKSSRFPEQGLINLLFYNRWRELPFFYCARPYELCDFYGLDLKKERVVTMHFTTQRPWDPHHPYYPEWSQNLQQAELIDLSRRRKVKDSWTDAKVRRKWEYFKFRRKLKSIADLAESGFKKIIRSLTSKRFRKMIRSLIS